MGIFGNLKDKAISSIIKGVVNGFLDEAGSIAELMVDTSRKEITAVLELKGEEEPIELQVLSYEIQQEEDRYFLIFGDIQTSREWLNILLKKHLTGRQLELPGGLAGQIAGKIL